RPTIESCFTSLTFTAILFLFALDRARSHCVDDMAWGDWVGLNRLKLNLGLASLLTGLLYSESEFVASAAGEDSVVDHIIHDDFVRRYWCLLLGQLWFFFSLDAWFTSVHQVITNHYLSSSLLLASSLSAALCLVAAFTPSHSTICSDHPRSPLPPL
ncbi:hypothetical protein L0F63_006539, partial [Massospora cicadina]